MNQEEMPSKEEIIKEIARLIESDPESEPMSLDLLGFMDEPDLLTIREGLLRNKANRPQEHQAWFDELVDKCSK